MRGGGIWNGGVEADAEKLALYTELEERLGALRRQPVRGLEIVPKATVAEIDSAESRRERALARRHILQFPPRPGNQEESPVERYLLMPRMLDDGDLAVLAGHPELVRRCRMGRRRAYRLMVVELRRQVRYVCSRYNNSAAPSRSLEEVVAFRRQALQVEVRLWCAYIMHALGLPRCLPVARSGVARAMSLFSAVSA